MELNSNFRSAPVLVDFNNKLFLVAATAVAQETGHPISVDAYRDVAQDVVANRRRLREDKIHSR